jgi:FMN phosphatase YigB (HAD superfamily)
MLISATLDLLGWAPWIDDAVTSIDVEHRNPARQMFDVRLRAARCEPGECVMVGDSEAADIEPAVVLGMRTLRVREPAAPKRLFWLAWLGIPVLTEWAKSNR